MRKLTKKIIINAGIYEFRVAVLESGKLEEFYIEQGGSEQIFGNVYKGIVQSVVPGIGAAFVDIGTGKNGFLYVSEIQSNNFLDDGDNESFGQEQHHEHHKGPEPKITDLVKVGQEIVVQVVKEAIGTKGPRLTTHISIAGRNMVITPFDTGVGISKRIGGYDERDRVRDIINELKLPAGMGCIVRTAAYGVSSNNFKRESKYLLDLWTRIKFRSQKVKAPALLYEEYGVVLRIIRDQFTEDVAEVVVDSKEEFKNIVRFVDLFMPALKGRVTFYNGKEPVFEKLGIEKEIEKIFQRKIPLRNGGSIVIEQTEGMVAIDVNTERYTGKSNLEETVYRTNLEAAKEVAKQVKLRDIGGIIVIDFIDMRSRDHNEKVQHTLEEALRSDKAKTKILKISSIGVVEMTRQRVRKSLEKTMFKDCPYCRGRGLVKSEATIALELLRNLELAAVNIPRREIDVWVNPSVHEYFTQNEKNLLEPLKRRCRKIIKFHKDERMHIEETKII